MNPNNKQQLPESVIKESTNTSPCQGIKDDLVECIRYSDCMNNGGTFHECMKSKDLDKDCKDLLYTFYKCRKDMFDTRNRFRGNVAAMAHAKDLTEKKTKRKENLDQLNNNNNNVENTTSPSPTTNQNSNNNQ